MDDVRDKTFFTHVVVKIVGLCSGENVLGGTEFQAQTITG